MLLTVAERFVHDHEQEEAYLDDAERTQELLVYLLNLEKSAALTKDEL